MTAPAPVVPRYRVDTPTPSLPAPYSLFTAATVLEPVPAHALMGVEYEAVCNVTVTGYPASCEPGADTLNQQKTPADTTRVVVGTPFVVYAADACVLGRDEGTALTQLRRRFEAGEAAAVENIIETGPLVNWPNLTTPDVLTTATPDLVGALGLLEQWLADTTGAPGVIHAPRAAGPRAFEAHQVTTSGPRAQTRMGSAWALGTGYSGGPPEGTTDDGSLWLYATPPVTIRRSAVSEPATWETGAFDRETNSALLLVERSYVADWPCGAAAVQTNLTRPGYVAPAV